MRTEFNYPVDYFLSIGEHEIYLNSLIGKQISMIHNGVINCLACGKKTQKSFAQGYCYQCFQTVPQADQSIVRPELSMSQFGIARDMEWAREHDLIDHIVYLSLTSGLKVGVTRHHQIPTRWIDQGAIKAIKLAKTPNRHIAGIIETVLKQQVADSTQWQSMLKDDVDLNIDLASKKIELGKMLHPELQKYLIDDNDITSIAYPGNYVSSKVVSVSFDRTSTIKGVLRRIKGQYLIFEGDLVFNIRKHSGYYISFKSVE